MPHTKQQTHESGVADAAPPSPGANSRRTFLSDLGMASRLLPLLSHVFQKEIQDIKDAGLYKSERIITSSQDAVIKISTGEEVINFCANNYLGLSSHPQVIEAAKDAIDTHGYGLSSVRFICGTQDIHKELERKIAEFLGMEDAILYAAAFDANGGLFEPLLTAEDGVLDVSTLSMM